MQSPPRQPDILLYAHIAINLAPGLSGNARSVGGAILAHWNRKTKQCDPSVERLATMLGIDRATVLRATAELATGEARLFDKKSHGGKAHRASYAPRWTALRAVVADWNERMLTGEGPVKVAKLRRSESQDCDVKRRKTATQTYCSNLLKEPAPVVTPATRPVKVPRKKQEPVGQGWLMLPLPGGQSRAEAAAEAAKRRIMETIHKSGPEAYALICQEATDAMLAGAAAAEVQQKGSGVRSLLTLVNDQILERRRA